MLASRPTIKSPIKIEAGYTLVEAAIATGLAALFFAALLVMNANVLGLLRNAKDNISASQTLQERVENMRIANWVQITDANYLANTLAGVDAASTRTLAAPIETVTVSAYPPTNPATTPARVIRQNGVTTILSANAALLNQRVVRVDVELTWRGFPRNRQRVRATTALIAKGGITK